MKDCDILYDEVFSLTDTIRDEVMVELENLFLPEKAFVFCGRYNEQFMFFDASGSEKDPPIMYYMIDADSFINIGNSVFDVIEEEVEHSFEIKQYYKQRKK